MICGIDEAGRGCCAGPLVVAGVVLNQTIEGLRDSKVLSEKKREELFDIIKENAKYKIVFCDNHMIDTKGLSFCLSYALKEIKKSFKSTKSSWMEIALLVLKA